MTWNFSQHKTREIPPLHRFGTPPRVLLNGPDTTLHQRISLMEMLRIEVDQIRTNNLVNRAFNPFHRYDTTLRKFNPNQIVWFHRKNHGWRKGTIQPIDLPIVNVVLGNRMYPTHETIV